SFRVKNNDLVLQILDFNQDVILTDWDFEVVSGDGFSPDANDYLRSTKFRERLQKNFALAIQTGRVNLPKIDITFLGPVLEAVNNLTAQSRVVDRAVLIGLDVASDDVTTAGSVSLLADFARVNDIAAVTNRVAVPILLGKVKPLSRSQSRKQAQPWM